MHRQVGVLKFDRNGLARRGLLVRQLVMPGLVEESAAIFRWMAKTLSPDTYVNIMAQYRPANRVPSDPRGGGPYAAIARTPRLDELEAAYNAAEQAGLWRFDERI
jgi:putative pyruvate formate lyase activating enzyme